MHHIYKYNKHKQIQNIKSYSIFYAVRQENPKIKSLHEAAEKLCMESLTLILYERKYLIQFRYKTGGFV